MPKHNDIVKLEPQGWLVGDIRSCIFTIRGTQVMLDKDLAVFYGVSTSRLNEQVKRNIKRFPERYRFQLTQAELNELIANCDRLKTMKHVPSLPYAFTEQGVSQLSSVLKSDRAVEVSILIVDAFVAMRRFIAQNAGVFQRIDQIEKHLIWTDNKVDETNLRIDHVLDKMEDGTLKHKLGVFFENQMFDAYVLFEKLVKRARIRIVLIDNYVDGEVLERLQIRQKGVSVDVYVQKQHKTRCMETAFNTYHQQYPSEHVELHVFNHSHDRWLIVDEEVYHFGASIKDLGKKWFEVSQITEYSADELLSRLNK